MEFIRDRNCCRLYLAGALFTIIGAAGAATPGLPFTEDFSDQALRDPALTTADWSAAQQAVIMADGGPRVPTYPVSGGNITFDIDPSTALAVGDIDRDGFPDVVVGNNGANNRLYLNDQSGGFLAGSTLGAETDATLALVLGDIDRDGDLDAIAGNAAGELSRLYLNDGAGAFPTATDLTDTGDTRALALGDVNGDGLLDVLAGNDGAANQLYLNDGMGGFDAPVDVAAGESDATLSLVLGDVDRDGDLDLITGNDGANRLYLNIAGVFTLSGAIGSETDTTRSLVLGDLDHDGDLDLVAGNEGQVNRVYFNDGMGVFSNTGAAAGDETDATRTLALGDIDEDGDLDLLVGNRLQMSRYYQNDGAGGFTAAGEQLGQEMDDTRAGALADMDDDGDLDWMTGNTAARNRIYLATGSSGFRSSGVSILSFVNKRTKGGGVPASLFFFADMDGDGDDDLVAAFETTANRYYANDGQGIFGGGGFDPESTTIGLEADTTTSLVIGDLDGDGDLDVVTGTPSSTQFNRVYLNDAGTFPAIGTPIGVAADVTNALVLGDVDRDGDLDLVTGNGDSSNLQFNRLFLNDGSGGFSGAGENIGMDAGATTALDIGDVDNDGDLDLVAGYSTDDMGLTNRLFRNNGGAFTSQGTNIGPEADQTAAIALADFNDDGNLDVLVGNADFQVNRLYEGNGVGGFAAAVDVGTETDNTTHLLVRDLDNDGDIDLLTGGTIRQYLNNGLGTLQLGPSLAVSSGSVALGDVEADGDYDLVTANSSAVTLYFNDTPGGFPDTGVAVAGVETAESELADVDNDGDLDLFVGGTLFFNDGAGAFASPGIIIGGGFIRAIAVGDLDNDGDVDLVTGRGASMSPQANQIFMNDGSGGFGGPVAQVGSDVEYTFDVAIGDVNGDGFLDIATASRGFIGCCNATRVYLNNGAGGFSSSSVVGNLGSQTVTLGDVDGDGDLDLLSTDGGQQRATRYLNNGSGSFGGGFVIDSGGGGSGNNIRQLNLLDVDNDADLDLLIMNGGIVLWRNDGAGGFTSNGSVGNARFGSFGDLDLDGDVDIATTTNFSQSRLLFNDGTGGFSSILIGPSGTSDAAAIGDVDNDGSLDVFLSELVYRQSRRAPQLGQAASLPINSGEGVAIATLTVTDEVNTEDSRNTGIDYYLSNNGGARWHQVYSGVPFTFPALGSDLRWRARLRSLSPGRTPLLTQIDIARTNLLPAASDGSTTATEDQPYTLVAEDFNYNDPENDPLASVRITVLPTKGALELNSEAVAVDQVIAAADLPNLQYTPLDDEFGPAYDSLDYRVGDEFDEAAATNTLTFDVTAVNDPPVGIDDTGPDIPGGTGFVQFAHGDLLANDGPGNLESDTLSIIAVGSAVGGTVALGPPIGFTPTPGFDGVASFEYTLQDNGSPPLMDTAMVSFNILPIPNGPPTLETPIPDLSRPVGAAIDEPYAIYFDDPDDDSLVFTATGLPASLTLNTDTGQLTGTTVADDLAGSPYTVTISADDQTSPPPASDEFELTLTNQAPQQLFPLGSYEPAAGENRLIDLAPHFADPDGLPLTFSVSGSTAASINALGQPGLLQVTPDASQVDQPLNLTVTVTDVVGSSIQADLVSLVVDSGAPDYRFERYYPSLQQPWYFSRITDIAGAPDGTIYLAEAERGKVQRFSRDGLLITQWGTLGAGPSQFSLLKLQIAVAPDGRVFAASGGRLQVFERNGRFLLQPPDFGEDILDLAIDDVGQLYLLFDRRVEIRSVDKLTGDFSSIALSRDGAALDVGPSGRVYVSVESPLNGAADQIRVFDPATLSEITAERVDTTDADALVVDAAEQVFAVGDTDGVLRAYTGGFEFLTSDVTAIAGDALAALAFDSNGRLYLSNLEAVIGLDAGLSQRSLAWQSASSEPGRFNAPGAATTDAAGNVYVLDARQSRVQKFDDAGVLLTQWNLQTPITDPDNRRVFIHATADNRVIVSTGQDLDVYDTAGAPGTAINVAGIDAPGPIGETRNGNLVITDATPGGFDVYQVNAVGQVTGSVFALDTCQVSDLAVGSDNLIYTLCEPGVAIREVQVYTQAGVKIRTFTNLPNGNPRALTLDDRDRIYLPGTENEVDLGSGVTTADSVLRIFQSDGVELTQLGSGGYSAGRFDFGGETAGADIGPNGELLLAEPGNNRVQVFQPAALGRNAKAIVVAGGGDYPENYLWEATQINTNNAYDKLLYQGFTAERILYLHPDPNLDLDGNPTTQEVDGDPSIANLAAAFAPGGFAEDADNLVLYLADHGNADIFRVNPIEVVTAAEVASWLAQLQDSTWPGRALPPGGFNGWVSVIYEACESGSFQDDLAPANNVPTNKRLVITTSNEGQNANFIAQGFLSFSYQFWINAFNGLDVREAFTTATLTIQDTYPEQDPILTIIENGQAISNLDDYFLQGRPKFNFAGRLIGNGTANSFAGPAVVGPQVPVSITNSASAQITVDAITDPDGVARAWLVFIPPQYQVRDSANPVTELPTIDLAPNPTGPLPDRYSATYTNFTTEGDYRVDVLAQDIFGNVTKYADTTLGISVGDPPKNKAILLISGDASPRGQAFADNGDFAYQALLRQDYVNDLDPATPGVTNLGDEIRYYTQGQFTGADAGDPSQAQLDTLTSAFVDSMTQNLVLYIAADYDAIADAFVFPGLLDPVTIAGLESFLDDAEGLILGKIILVLEGNDSGTVVGRLVDGSSRRYVLTATGQGGTSTLTVAGGISFSRFFWNAVRDGFSLGSAFQLAKDAIAGVASVQTPLIDDNGNGIANEVDDQVITRTFFLGPGITRAGNGPLVGGAEPDLVIDDENTNTKMILAEDVSGTSLVSRVIGAVTVPGSGIDLGTFSLSPTTTQKGSPLINLGDFQGTFSGFRAAGDYNIAIYAVDENGDPSSPQFTSLRKSAGPDIYEQDDTPNSGTQTLLGAAQQRHTIHSVTAADPNDDEDWLIISLTDEPNRQARLTFSQIDAGLTLSVQLFDQARLSNPAAIALLDTTVLSAGGAPQDVNIDDSLAGGRYVVRIAAGDINNGVLQDPSPGYLVGLADPFADLEGQLTGKVFDATTMQPIGSSVLGLDGNTQAGQTFSCFRNCGPLGGPGGFRLSLPQGSYDLQVQREGYVTQTISGFAVTPGGTTPISPNPILLVPEGSATPPTVASLAGQGNGEDTIVLSGTINANGSEATGQFLIGEQGMALQPANGGFLMLGSSAQSVTTAVSGLNCETSYQFSLTASNAGGSDTTPTQTLATGACSIGPLIFVDGFESPQ